MQILIYTVVVLGALGLVGGALLYFISRKFRVDEDPRIAEIESHLAGANCGGCGFSGCHAFAVECVRRGNTEGLHCPGSGPEIMATIAGILGCEAQTPQMRNVAVLRCSGSCAARPKTYEYDGTRTCAIMDAAGVGTSGCSFGCLGCGDCVAVCPFDAIHMNPETGLPEIDAEKCTACGKCTTECPRHLLELRPVGKLNRRVWVACASRDRGPVARKICSAACIGCGKCLKACPFGAITKSDNLSYNDPTLCRSCGKCIPECPTGAILATFKPVQPKKPAAEGAKSNE